MTDYGKVSLADRVLADRVLELWKQHGGPSLRRESWCQGFEGPTPDDYAREQLSHGYQYGKTRIVLFRPYGCADATSYESDLFMNGSLTLAELRERVDARSNPNQEIKVERGTER